MWILTTIVFMAGLGLFALLGIRPHQVIVLVLGYLLSYLLLWIVGPLVDWFATGPSQPGPFTKVVQALNTPQRPATIPTLILVMAPAAMVALWMAAEFDPVLFFLTVVVSFSAAQAIRPFSLRQDLLRAITSLPRRFVAEHIGPNWQPPPFGRRRGTDRPQGSTTGGAGGIRVNLPPQGNQQVTPGTAAPVDDPGIRADLDDPGQPGTLDPDLRAGLDGLGS